MNPIKRSIRTQAGLSLVELMVAMAIGVVLMLGLVQIFGATRLAFSSAEGLARVQENARFSMDILRNELRMVGHVGCLDARGYIRDVTLVPLMYNHAASPAVTPAAPPAPELPAFTNLATAPFALRLDMPVEAYEFVGSSPGQTLNLSAGPSTGVGAGSFSPALPAALADLTTDALRGSDIIVLRFLSAESARSVVANVATSTLSVNNPADVGFFERGGMYGISNCYQLTLFQARSGGPTVAAGQGGLNTGNWTAREDGYASPATSVHRYEYAVYYVGLDAASGQPALRVRRFDENRANLLSTPQSLVEGIESMQLVFGADVGPNRDDVLDRYYTANGVVGLDAAPRNAWARVLNVRVGLLTRSTNPGGAVRDATSPPLRVADTVVTVPDDGRVRQVYETSITMRNRVRN